MSDAGPLIALARIDLLFLLHELFTEVVVPTAVIDELRLREPRPGAEALAEATRHQWLRSMVPTDERPVAGLGVGESSAIRLALQLRCPLLVDERRGRIAARNHELTIIGTGRVLLDAKQRNLIDTVAGAVDALKATGYRLSTDSVRAFSSLLVRCRCREVGLMGPNQLNRAGSRKEEMPR